MEAGQSMFSEEMNQTTLWAEFCLHKALALELLAQSCRVGARREVTSEGLETVCILSIGCRFRACLSNSRNINRCHQKRD